MIRVLVIAAIVVVSAGAGAWLVVDAQHGTTHQAGRAATLAEVAARVNPPEVDRYPAVVARITSGEFSTEASGKSLAGLIAAAEVRGESITEREARDQLIAAGLLQLAVKKRGLEASEEEAAGLYREVAACLAGVAEPGAPCSGPPPPDMAEIGEYILANSTEAQLIEAYRSGLGLGRLRAEILKNLTPEERANPTTVDERYAAFIEQERRSAAVVEVFGEDGDFGCTEDGDETPCPSDILATLGQGRAP